MPTVDLWGVLNGVKNVAAFLWSSKVALLVVCSSFVVGALTVWLNWWGGWILPSIEVEGNWLYVSELDGGELSQIVFYCLHSDYAIAFVNFAIGFVNVFFPFMTGLLFSLMVFRFTVFLKHAVGTDIKEAT